MPDIVDRQAVSSRRGSNIQRGLIQEASTRITSTKAASVDGKVISTGHVADTLSALKVLDNPLRSFVGRWETLPGRHAHGPRIGINR